MIISKLKKVAGVVFVLALTTGTLFAQRGNGRNAALNGQNSICLNRISGLTTEQTEKIRELDNKHLEEMAQLREERRSTSDFDKKNEIRSEMLKNVESHRSEVKSLLNADQQKEFDSIQRFGNANAQQGNRFAFGNNGNRGFRQGVRGNGNCRGNFNGNGRGNNRKQMRGNNQNRNFGNGYRGGFNSSDS